LCLPGKKHKLIQWTSAFFTLVPLILCIPLLSGFVASDTGMQFAEKYSWIPSWGISYHLGLDGLSLPMVLLTCLIGFLGCLNSFNIDKRVKEYFFFYLLLVMGMLGVFCALDMFLFYLFWEIMLVPMYFLIGVWGGPRKEYAAIKFFLYTLFGSVLMLLAMLALYFTSDPHTFDLLALRGQGFERDFQMWVYIALFIGFAIKVPVFPFHTWLPDAHVEAPTAISVILAGILLKMGTYGILRISYPILPMAATSTLYTWGLAILGLVNIIYGALVAMAQTDLKKMIAYSSVSHMGFCLLGMAAMNATGFTGCVMQMFAHGLVTGTLFMLVGVVYDRAHTRDIDAFGGLAVKMPIFSALMILSVMASLGLPGMVGFVGEFICLLGTYKAFPVVAILALPGIVLTAGYLLWMLQRIFLGPFNKKWDKLTEINGREVFCICTLQVLIIFFGLYPRPVLELMNPTLQALVKLVTA